MAITLNGKKYECPVCYEELKTRHYQRILKEWEINKSPIERDYLKLFCILTDSDFKSFHATSENEVTIWNAIAWFNDSYLDQIDEQPKALQIKDQIVSIPENIKELSIGQNIHVRQAIDSTVYLGESISLATAIYLQPIIDQSAFDYKKALKIDAIIQEMPAYLIKPIGFFLLSRAKKHGMKPMNFLKKIQRSLNETLKKMSLIWLSGKGSHLMRMLVW